jgi:hypothetical protein
MDSELYKICIKLRSLLINVEGAEVFATPLLGVPEIASATELCETFLNELGARLNPAPTPPPSSR